MKVVGGIVGALLGFAAGIALVEVIFVNSQSWPDVVPVALAAAGWLIGSTVAQRVHRPKRGSRLSRSP
jgi:uncharacterized membrane protein YfcA